MVLLFSRFLNLSVALLKLHGLIGVQGLKAIDWILAKRVYGGGLSILIV